MNPTPWRFASLLILVGAAACAPSRSTFPTPAIGGTIDHALAPPAPATGATIDRVLAPLVTPAFQSRVLVLGTSHLAGEQERLTAGHLAPLIAVLGEFAPTRIAIEALTADELALLAEREPHDPAAARVLDMFGRGVVTAGRSMQQALGIDRVTAEQRAHALLPAAGRSMTDAERLAAVGYLLAAFDYHSATLQWSYLPPAVRDEADIIPAEIRGMLQRRLQGANEIVTLAIPLARRLGLQRLHAMDSQYDGVRTLSMPQDALAELFSDPARGSLEDRGKRQHADSIREAAFADGDLLPLYLHVNSAEHLLGDLTQWHWLFENRHSSGLDRFRYAMWEVRNLRQALHIIDVAASGEAERVLVIVGSSHKAYLDRVLATQLGVQLVQLEQVIAAPALQ
jgi:hypothetical protein